VILVLLTASVAVAAPGEVAIAGFPVVVEQVAATPAGGAWVLGRGPGPGSDPLSGQGPTLLWHVGADGAAQRVDFPRHLAAERIAVSPIDGLLWIAGRAGAAWLAEGSSWVPVAYPAGRSAQQIVPVAEGTAVVLRRTLVDTKSPALGLGTEALVLSTDASEPQLSASFHAHGFDLRPAVADGLGGIWALLRLTEYSPDGRREARGFVHSALDGDWYAWSTVPDPHPRLDHQGEAPWRLGAGERAGAFLTGDGAGGFVAGGTNERLFRVNSDGAVAEVPPEAVLGGDSRLWRAVVAGPAPGELVVLFGGELRSGPVLRSESWEVVRLDPIGQAVEREPVPCPEWLGGACSFEGLHLGGGVTWIAGRQVVLRRDEAGWTVLAAETVRRRIEETRRESANRIVRASLLGTVGLGVGLAGGALGAGTLHGAPLGDTAAHTGGAALLGAAPMLLALAASPWTQSSDGPAISPVGLLIGASGATLLGGLGAWGTDELLLEGTPSTGVALAGSTVGALAGVLVGLGVDALLEALPGDLQALGWSVAVGLVGGGAAAGYQVAVGRP